MATATIVAIAIAWVLFYALFSTGDDEDLRP